MPTALLTASTTNPDPALAPEGEPTDPTFLDVRRTARSIAGRVRRALLPDGAEFAPLRVLVVDDHPDAADALVAVLELLDCPARACHDGPTALAAAAEFQPQVCLLDLLMPEMDGLELATRLQEQAGSRPLLLVAATALSGAEARTRTALAGFHYHLTKPLDTVVLVEALVHLGEILARSTKAPPVGPADTALDRPALPGSGDPTTDEPPLSE